LPAITAPHLHDPTIPDLALAAAAAPRHRPLSQSDEQQVLSIRGLVAEEDAQRFIADALHDIRVFMQEHDLSPAGPPFSIHHLRGDDLDIEAGWPTATRPLAGTSRIRRSRAPRICNSGSAAELTCSPPHRSQRTCLGGK
jgi:hypothetical protein